MEVAPEERNLIERVRFTLTGKIYKRGAIYGETADKDKTKSL